MGAHALSRAQTQAVREVMRMFTEEDLAHGVARDARRSCERCRRERPAAGFIRYAGATLCNTCATAYELARLRHVAVSVTEWVQGDGGGTLGVGKA
jgi:hypothetical protein